MVFSLTPAQLDWVEAIRIRYWRATGIQITVAQVVMRTLEHGYSISENEMAAIEQDFDKSKIYKQSSHLWLVKKP